MKNTKKKTITKTPVKPKKHKHPNQMTDTELRRKYSSWMKHFVYGVGQITELPKRTQHYLWFCVLQETLYNPTTNPFLHQMYKSDPFPVDTDMNDTELSPLNRKRLFSGMENLITNGGRKKFVGVLNGIDKSYSKGEY